MEWFEVRRESIHGPVETRFVKSDNYGERWIGWNDSKESIRVMSGLMDFGVDFPALPFVFVFQLKQINNKEV